MTFEEYLSNKHAEQYHGLDDLMPDDFVDWMEGLDLLEVIEWAQKWHDAELVNF